MFIDETEILVSSGRGGDGVVSFRREKYIPHGGPDGGDGGSGGDVILRAVARLDTLAGVQHGRHYRAGHGERGGGGQCTGRDGESLTIEVPAGTIIRDAERGHVLRDLVADGDSVVVATGGAGGKGNRRFAHSTNQTPRRATPGHPGESRRLRLELRLVADVGLVGLPNAGKSTFLRRVSEARPKVAEYPFTTLEPVLGLLTADHSGLVLADIPGLIEGAHRGVGLGLRFLRHVARTRVLLHLVDGAAGADAALTDWRTVRKELALAGIGLDDKPSVVAVSRSDLCDDPWIVAGALAEAGAGEVVCLSSHSGQGVADVLARIHRLVASGKEGDGVPSKH